MVEKILEENHFFLHVLVSQYLPSLWADLTCKMWATMSFIRNSQNLITKNLVAELSLKSVWNQLFIYASELSLVNSKATDPSSVLLGYRQ